MSVFLGLLKAISEIPALISLFDEFAAWYVGQRLKSMQADDASAIIKAVQDHDQRPIESAIGSPLAGQPSDDPGVSIIDAPPIGLPK